MSGLVKDNNKLFWIAGAYKCITSEVLVVVRAIVSHLHFVLCHYCVQYKFGCQPWSGCGACLRAAAPNDPPVIRGH